MFMKMQPISAFLDITKVKDLRCKNTDVSRTQDSRGVLRGLYIFWMLFKV